MGKEVSSPSKEVAYNNIRTSIINAQSTICRAVNSAIVQAYWEIGEQIYKECGENERAESKMQSPFLDVIRKGVPLSVCANVWYKFSLNAVAFIVFIAISFV